jgi:hypothetical protein
LTGFVENKRFAAALEQRLLKIFLQSAELSAQSGLGKVQPFCGSRETSLCRDSAEITQMVIV